VVLVAWVETRRSSQDVRPDSCPSVLEPADGACDDDEGRQRSVMCEVKAAPADEARVVRHLRRREAPPLEALERGFTVDAKAAP